MPTIIETPLAALQNNELEREFELDVRVSLPSTEYTTETVNVVTIRCTTTSACTDNCSDASCVLPCTHAC